MTFFLQFNFLDRRLKNAKSSVEISLVLFFKFSNFCKISHAPAISLHSGNKFPSCSAEQVGNLSAHALQFARFKRKRLGASKYSILIFERFIGVFR